MKKLLLIGLSVFAFSVIAGDKVDKIIDVSATGEVEIHNTRGQVVVKGWNKNQVKIKGQLDDLAEKFIFSHEGDKTLIKVILPRSNSNSKSGRGSDLKIFVPMNVVVTFNGISTDIDMNNIQGGVDINSVSGDIEIENIGKRALVNSVSGKIKLNSVDGNVEVSTVSGNVDAKVSAGTIYVNGVSSEITVRAKKIKFAKLSSVSGNAKLYASLEKEGDIKMSSVSGNSYFYTKDELNAKVVLETGPGGNVSNGYSDDKPTSSFIGSEKLKFTAGRGDGLIRMYTVSGTVGLKKN